MLRALTLLAATYIGYRYLDQCTTSIKEDKGVDKASKSSFPASDPPSGNQFTSTEPRNSSFQQATPSHP